MVRIPVNTGFEALIDDEDFDWASRFRWWARRDGSRRVYAAAALPRVPGEKRTCIYLHRLIMREPAGAFVDHINGDTLDNRRVNLRIASHQNNVRNRRNRKPTRTGYKGVWPNVANGRKTGRFTAIIRVSPKKRIHLGSYDTPEEAAKVYDAAATAYFGAFANLNFQLPQEDICA